MVVGKNSCCWDVDPLGDRDSLYTMSDICLQ